MKWLLAKLSYWVHANWLCLDQWLNVFFFFGSPTETISGRMGRYMLHPTSHWRNVVGTALGSIIDFGAWLLTRERFHCINTYLYELSIHHRPEVLGDEKGD